MLGWGVCLFPRSEHLLSNHLASLSNQGYVEAKSVHDLKKLTKEGYHQISASSRIWQDYLEEKKYAQEKMIAQDFWLCFPQRFPTSKAFQDAGNNWLECLQSGVLQSSIIRVRFHSAHFVKELTQKATCPIIGIAAKELMLFLSRSIDMWEAQKETFIICLSPGNSIRSLRIVMHTLPLKIELPVGNDYSFLEELHIEFDLAERRPSLYSSNAIHIIQPLASRLKSLRLVYVRLQTNVQTDFFQLLQTMPKLATLKLHYCEFLVDRQSSLVEFVDLFRHPTITSLDLWKTNVHVRYYGLQFEELMKDLVNKKQTRLLNFTTERQLQQRYAYAFEKKVSKRCAENRRQANMWSIISFGLACLRAQPTCPLRYSVKDLLLQNSCLFAVESNYIRSLLWPFICDSKFSSNIIAYFCPSPPNSFAFKENPQEERREIGSSKKRKRMNYYF